MSVYRPSNARKRSTALRQRPIKTKTKSRSLSQNSNKSLNQTRFRRSQANLANLKIANLLPVHLVENRMLRGGLVVIVFSLVLSSVLGAGSGELAATSLETPSQLKSVLKNAKLKNTPLEKEAQPATIVAKRRPPVVNIKGSQLELSEKADKNKKVVSLNSKSDLSKTSPIENSPTKNLIAQPKNKIQNFTAARASLKAKDIPQPQLIVPNIKEPKEKEKGPSNAEWVNASGLISSLASGGRFVDQKGFKHSLTVDSKLQSVAEDILDRYKVPWGAIVALEPDTGKVLAMASRGGDSDGNPIALRAGFPAASLFKLVTGAAAIEESGMTSQSMVSYRGGNYSLNKGNYLPDRSRDKRSMSLGEAMGKSVNPVFARVALGELSADILKDYASKFGFFDPVSFDLPVEASSFATIEDDFQLARTSAGFGEVGISPLHAAVLSASIGNGGVMMRPYIVDQVEDQFGRLVRKGSPQSLGRIVLDSTAQELTGMMEKTLTTGTGRKQFRRWKGRDFKIAGKTGTLSGKNPKGRYHWFVGNAPSVKPDISVAALVIDPGNARINGTGMARLFLEKFFKGQG